MFRVELHEYIERTISVFYRVGAWHRKEEPTVGERRLKIFYSVYNFLLIISMIVGTLETSDIDEFIFLVEFTFVFTVLMVKFFHIIWRKAETLRLLDSICCFSVDDPDKFTQLQRKLNILMKFIVVFVTFSYVSAFCIVLVIPFLGCDKTFFVSIGFPLDWKNDEFAYWMAFAFLFTQGIIASISVLFSAIIWYLMTNCDLRYEVLGQQIKTMGQVKSVERIGIVNGRKISDTERDNLYLRDLLACIASHTHLKESTNELDSFLSELFVTQLTTSALGICCSIYILAFSSDATTVEYLVYIITLFYNIFDIFMIMNFGNEIELASDNPSFQLYDSDWIERPESTKKIVLIFGELLMRPHQLVVLKLYPLNLDTFTRILNSAYSTFNILQNFK